MTSLLLIKSMIFAHALQKSQKKKIKKKLKKMNKKEECLCRICEEETGIIPIFDNLRYPNIPEEIKNISGVTITESQFYSNNMCRSCLDLMNGCIIFRDLCIRSSKKIREVPLVKTEIPELIDNEKEEDKNQPYSEDSYHAPSPSMSEEEPGLWGCSLCNKEFKDPESYNNHLSMCSNVAPKLPKPVPEVGKKKFLCDTCGKTAPSNASLLIHMSTHENVFPFKCDICPYQGRTIDLLKVHKRVHLKDKPYKCTQCPKATTTSSNLAKHVRHVHNTTRPFKCTYCDKAFSYQHDMKRHVRDIHLRQGTVECDVCSKKFNTKKILQGHRLKIHKIKSERQGRLPSYLQCQQIEDNVNINDSI